MLFRVFLLNCLFSVALPIDLCASVRHQYTEMALGLARDVPSTFQPGKICQPGCCTAEMEGNFYRPSREVYRDISIIKFNRAYREIKLMSEQFQMSIEHYLLHNTRIALQQCATLHSNETNQLHYNQTTHDHKIDVLYLYKNVTSYFTQVNQRQKTNLRKTIKAFAKEKLNLRKLRGLTCVNEVSSDLQKRLTAAWAVKESLKFGRSLFNSIRSWDVSPYCQEALIRMNYCPLCDPNNVYQHTRPCTKYCLNVQRGCLAPLLHISPMLTEWSRQLQHVILELREEFPAVTKSFNHLVHSILVTEDPLELCEHTDTQFEDSSVTSLRLYLGQLVLNLQMFENLFEILPYQICSQHNTQPGLESFCWNGTAMSTYNCRLADEGLYSLNPTQVVYGDPMLQEQGNRLSEMVALLYDVSGQEQPPTESIATVESSLDEELCWDPIPEEDNTSDKRDHTQSEEELAPFPARSSSLPNLANTPLLLLLLLLLAQR